MSDKTTIMTVSTQQSSSAARQHVSAMAESTGAVCVLCSPGAGPTTASPVTQKATTCHKFKEPSTQLATYRKKNHRQPHIAAGLTKAHHQTAAAIITWPMYQH
jgi:hypothetical protein